MTYAVRKTLFTIGKFLIIFSPILYFSSGIIWYLALVNLSFFILGSSLNLLVIGVNKGKMPVLAKQYGVDVSSPKNSNKYVEMDAKTKLRFLGDIIKTKTGIMSVGDVLIDLGLLVFIFLFILIVLVVLFKILVFLFIKLFLYILTV